MLLVAVQSWKRIKISRNSKIKKVNKSKNTKTVATNRKIALCNIKKSSLKNDSCVIKLDKNFKNTKTKKSVSENKQTRWVYRQAEPKNLGYNSGHNCKENKKSVLENKPTLKQKPTKNVISYNSFLSRSEDETVKKYENKKSILIQSSKQTAPVNNCNFNLTHPRLVDEAGKKNKNKKNVSENNQSQRGHKQIAKNLSYCCSIHEQGDKVNKSPNEKWVPKNKQTVFIYTQTANPKKIRYFCSSHILNKKVENLKNKESASDSKQSVWRYKQAAPPKTVSYFKYLGI